MRLALGFCGQFAKATFSSLSITKLEVEHNTQVRGFTVALWLITGGDAFYYFF